MSIQPDDNVFPNNIISLVVTRAKLLDADLYVTSRPLRNSDPIQSIGVFARQWVPMEDSYEISGTPFGRHEPTLQRYPCVIQAFIKDTEEERGASTHAVLAGMLRTMLYRDEPLRIGLSMLSSTIFGKKEQTKRWSVSQQRYFSNEIQGSWMYLSNLEFWLETEMQS